MGPEGALKESEGGRPESVPQETLLDVLARMVASGDTWAVKVQDRRAGRHGGYLTEAEKNVLRKRRDEEPRPTVTAADETDTAAIVGAYETARRRILGDRQYAALTADWNDARKILPDLRLLRERRKVIASLAEIVAHKLETYLRDPKNRGVNFALRWLLDRTEQDDLPRPKAKARGSPEVPLDALPARNTRKVAAPLSVEEQRDLEELKKRLKGNGDGK